MRAKRLAAAEARSASAAPEDPDRRDVSAGLRNLGYRIREAEEAAVVCASMREARLEQKFRAALRQFQRVTGSRPVLDAAASHGKAIAV